MFPGGSLKVAGTFTSPRGQRSEVIHRLTVWGRSLLQRTFLKKDFNLISHYEGFFAAETLKDKAWMFLFGVNAALKEKYKELEEKYWDRFSGTEEEQVRVRGPR